MAAGIAHDLNNSLAPVVGFSELLLSENEALTERQREWLRLVHIGALDAARTVARLGQAYRLRTPGDDCETIEIAHLARQVVALMRPAWFDAARADGRSIDVVMELGLAPALSGNGAELREALTSLMKNAVDALPMGGTIAVQTREEGGCAVVEVSDTGTGMTEAVRVRCLEPFFTTKGPRSSGLGLSFVHGAVERQGGRIEIESAPGAGTTFRLILPVAAAATAAARALGAVPLQRDALDRRDQVGGIERLGDVGGGADEGGEEGDVAVAAQRDDGGAWAGGVAVGAGKLEAAQVGQVGVEDDGGGWTL